MLGPVHACAVVQDGPRDWPPRWRKADLGLRRHETLPSAGYDKTNARLAGDRSRPAYRRVIEERSEEEGRRTCPGRVRRLPRRRRHPIDNAPQPRSNGIESPGEDTGKRRDNDGLGARHEGANAGDAPSVAPTLSLPVPHLARGRRCGQPHVAGARHGASSEHARPGKLRTTCRYLEVLDHRSTVRTSAKADGCFAGGSPTRSPAYFCPTMILRGPLTRAETVWVWQLRGRKERHEDDFRGPGQVGRRLAQGLPPVWLAGSDRWWNCLPSARIY